MQIVRVSDPILLPLAPTIAGAIANYLQLKAQQVRGHLSHNCDNLDTELPPDLSWEWQFERLLQPVTTLQYQYVSTIAHRLAAKSSLNPVKICESLQSLVAMEIPCDVADLELSCWYNDAGYIYFEVAEPSIERWLEYIHNIPFNLKIHADRAVCDPTLAIYAHARCCAVLRLADRERIVAIDPDWQMSSADWLACSQQDRLSAQLTSIYDRAAEQRLIKTLMAVLDAIYSPSALGVTPARSTQQMRAPNWTRLTIDLAQSWLEFYRYCQIFGDLKRQNPRLAIARCGLTAISRRYLQLLLENYLGVSALVEL